MPPKNKQNTNVKRVEAPYESQSGCPSCNTDEPHVRARHQLFLARTSLDDLREHLQKNYGQKLNADDRKQAIDDCCHWVAGMIRLWSGYVHPETGATLKWWEAQDHAHAMPTPEDTEHPDAAWKTSGAFLPLPTEHIRTLLTTELAKHAKDPWARGHILLMETGVNRVGREQDAAEACRRFARHWPRDSEAWELEALWYAKRATPHTGMREREPGEEG